MGGKKYPKNKSGSEGSSGTQQSSTSSASGGQPQASVGSARRQLQQLAISSSEQAGGQSHPQRESAQQPRQQQSERQQQQPGAQQQGQRQQQQQWPEPGQGRGRGRGLPQQQQQQRPQQQQQQQQRPQQQQQQRPQQQQQQQQRPQQQQQQQQQQRPQQQQQQRPQQQQPKQKQQAQKDDRHPQQQGLSRAESTQSIQSDKSQSASSSASGGRAPQKQSPPKLSMEGIETLSVKYKGPGTKGRQLGFIETNYLKIIMNKLVDCAYHYDVKIEPDKPKKLLTKVFLEFAKKNFPKASIAFDGTNNAYASQPINTEKLAREVTIIHPETKRERRYTVAMQAANDSAIPIKQALTSYQHTPQNADPKRAMQAMEVILKSAFHQDHLKNGILGGRSFFLPPTGRRIDLGDFYELWLGLFQSMVLGEVPFLNVDVNHKAFPRRYGTLVDLLKEMGVRSPNSTLDRDEEEKLRRHLAGLEIVYTAPNANGMVYKFMAIVDKPANIRFTLDNGQQKSILQYFNDTGRRIQYPELNCIKLGNTIKNISVPLEFCSIPDTQVINKKCTENQTRNIIRFAATSTDERKNKIMDLLRQIKHNNSSTIQGFGLGIETEFTKVPARLLDAPNIQYGNKIVTPSKGVWRGESMQFLFPEEATAWSILNTNYRTRMNELQELAQMLYKCSRPTGLGLAERPTDIKTIQDRQINDIRKEIDRIGQRGEIKILFVVVPDNGSMYAQIKQFAEINSGVLTQCIKGGTVFKKRNDGSTISNILLKVNAKLNGTNHKLQTSPIVTTSKCMLIGADVTHPSPDQTKIPSVVGVAASHDSNAFCYNICWRLQGQRVEIIQDFKEIMKEHLKFYKDKNGYLPEKILYYRDGVSEGQFDQVMATERNAMHLACREIQQGYEKQVKMTIVVVQKRHHTRFFPGNTGVGRDDRKNNNVPAGTIVDKVITRPNENHFYLVSHQSIQGVAKPTKYCILLDEGNHTIDDLQGLTYNLCHLFSRCNRSVSYPAPTYYAHLAAYRGRVYIENQNLNMNNLQNEWNRRQIQQNIIKGHPMYFV